MIFVKSELLNIPGVGKKTAEDLINLGYSTIKSLAGADPEALYARDCALRGIKIDRCQLYVYRAAVYFAEHEHPDPEKLKWWNHSDQNLKKKSADLPRK